MENAYKKPARALIEAAERLIATQGLGVPLREIGQAAGAANKVAVQYHFGDRERLIEAVFHYRLPQLETRRAALLAEIEARGLIGEPTALLDVLFRPIGEIVDSEGRRRFAGFLYQVTANARSARAAFDDIAPVAGDVVARLGRALPGMAPSTFRRRLGGAALIFLDTLVRFEEDGESGRGAGTAEALALAAAVLTGPVIE